MHPIITFYLFYNVVTKFLYPGILAAENKLPREGLESALTNSIRQETGIQTIQV